MVGAQKSNNNNNNNGKNIQADLLIAKIVAFSIKSVHNIDQCFMNPVIFFKTCIFGI